MRKELVKRWLIRDKYEGKENPTLLQRDFARLSAGEPLDYVIGWKEFCGVHVDLSLRPLISREETEHWVREILPHIKKVRAPRVLDLCAGSGAVGLAVLAHHPRAQITFADLSPRAVRQIKKNLEFHPQFKKRARVQKSNLFSAVTGKFDFILTNPPYIPSARIAHLPRSVRDFEPRRALDGGGDGLRLIKKIIADAPAHLSFKGTLVIEVDSKHAQHVATFARTYFTHATIHKDQYKRPRVLILKK